MIVHVDPDAPVPPYEQVRAQVEAMIVEGELPEGHRLPPIRQLAADLGLAAGTVARTYRELEAAGLVETRGRNGTLVAPDTQWRLGLDPVQVQARLDDATSRYVTLARSAGLSADEALARVRAALASPPSDARA